MPSGFRFAETMSGTFVLADDPDTTREFSFSVVALAPSLWRHLTSGGELGLSGSLEAAGFADGVAILGTMIMAPLTRRIISYEFEFAANDGRRYRFQGQKDIRLSNLRASFTTLPGVVTDAEGQIVARVQTLFNLKADWRQFLGSWRPA